MDSEDHEFAEAQVEEENEYCIVCHTVYVAEEGCWCVEPGAGRGNELDRTRSSVYPRTFTNLIEVSYAYRRNHWFKSQ
jgi:hypothetical protein